MPSALAVLALISSSNAVGCSVGISPGFAPSRNRLTSVLPRPGTRAIVCHGAPPITAWRKANEKNEISGQRHVISRNSGSPRSRGKPSEATTTATLTGPAGTVLLIEGRVFSCGQRCKRGFTALVASVADPKVFRSGRDFSAWVGQVPKQNSTGGKERQACVVAPFLWQL
jgi:Transposase IS116/IS110/IS902 family